MANFLRKKTISGILKDQKEGFSDAEHEKT